MNPRGKAVKYPDGTAADELDVYPIVCTTGCLFHVGCFHVHFEQQCVFNLRRNYKIAIKRLDSVQDFLQVKAVNMVRYDNKRHANTGMVLLTSSQCKTYLNKLLGPEDA